MEQKKLIFIILSLALLIFIFVFGINTYYKENKQTSYDQEIAKIMEPAQLVSRACLSNKLEDQYRICCSIQKGIKEGLFYDCSSQEYFEPGQNLYIIFNPSKFDIPFSPYYLYIYSDLNSGLDTQNNEPIASVYEESTVEEREDSLMKIVGIIPQEVESLILLKAIVYSNDVFDERDEQVIIYREAKISKE